MNSDYELTYNLEKVRWTGSVPWPVRTGGHCLFAFLLALFVPPFTFFSHTFCSGSEKKQYQNRWKGRDLRFRFKENLEAEPQLTFLYSENAYKVLGLVSFFCKESSALLTNWRSWGSQLRKLFLTLLSAICYRKTVYQSLRYTFQMHAIL